MHPFDTYFKLIDFHRQRTLLTLDEVARQADPAAALGWRPGSGRAHIAWQMMHIGVTEALFATERLLGTMPPYPELVPRFKGGAHPMTTFRQSR